MNQQHTAVSMPSSTFKVTLLLEPLTSGEIAASVMEFPKCRVEAATRGEAIANLKTALIEHLQPIEVIPLELSVSASTTDLNPWVPLFGMFEDNRYFDEVMAIVEAERETAGDEDIDPAFYQPKDLS
jgi:predicted RNase H-like HicB family nuclease